MVVVVVSRFVSVGASGELIGMWLVMCGTEHRRRDDEGGCFGGGDGGGEERQDETGQDKIGRASRTRHGPGRRGRW